MNQKIIVKVKQPQTITLKMRYPVFGKGDKGDKGEEIILRNENEVIQWKYESDSDWIDLLSVADLSGPQGEQGEQGPAGTNGPTGATGEKGDKGDKGDIGDTGPQGIQGIQGVQGVAGADGGKKIVFVIPGEIITDTSGHVGIFHKNDTGVNIILSTIDVSTAIVASGSGSACTVNFYKSSGTPADGIDTNATAICSTAIALGTSYSSLGNIPTDLVWENGRYLSMRVTTSAGATNKAQDLLATIHYL